MKHVKLIDENKEPDEIIKYVCKNCNAEMQEPESWELRFLFGMIFLLCALLPGIIFFFKTSPWTCPKCEKREFLTKIYNNGDKEDIEAKPKDEFVFNFVAIAIAIGIILAYIYLNKRSY